jgi:hypothetical protein
MTEEDSEDDWKRIHMRVPSSMHSDIEEIAENRHSGVISKCLRHAFIIYNKQLDEKGIDPELRRLEEKVDDLLRDFEQANDNLVKIEDRIDDLANTHGTERTPTHQPDKSDKTRVWEAVGGDPKRIEDIVEQTGLSYETVQKAVSALEDSSQIKRQQTDADNPPRFTLI